MPHEASTTAQGTCYGYSVRSALALRLLRPGDGEPLVVTSAEIAAPESAPVMEWTEDGVAWARLWAAGERFVLWQDRSGYFAIDPRVPAIGVPDSADGIRHESRIWGIPAALCFADRGDISLHGAAVDIGGKAVALAAPGYHGKTTLAAAFVQAGHRLLSEDNTCISPGSQPMVWPGPPLLRIRSDVREHLEVPNGEIVAEDPNRAFFVLDGAGRGNGNAVPLGAIVFLHPAADGTRFEIMPPKASIQNLWSLSFKLPTDEDRARCFSRVTALATQVTTWSLHRQLSFDGLPDLVTAIIETCLDD